MALVCLGNVHRQDTQFFRDGVHEVNVATKLIAQMSVAGCILPIVIGDEVESMTIGVGVKGDAIALAHQVVKDVSEVLHPIARWVFGVFSISVPGGHRCHDDLVVLSPGPGVDVIPALLVATGVELRRDNLSVGTSGPLPGQIGLVADDPDVAALGAGYEVAAALGEVVVAVGVGDGAFVAVPVVEAHDDPQALIGQVAVVRAAWATGVCL